MKHWMIAVVAAGVGCGGGSSSVDGMFSDDEWAQIEMLSPLPDVPPDPTNAYADDDRAAILGQRLFFERGYAGPLATASDLGNAGETGKVACASCHVASTWFSDSRSNPNNVSLAANWTGRNTPPVVNAMFYKWFFWDGRKDSMWSQALGPPEGPVEINGSRLAVAHVLFAKYRADYDAIFTPALDPDLDPASAQASRFPATGKPGDASWNGMAPADQDIVNRIYANFGKAIAAYERRLVSRDAPFDLYVAGQTSAISSSAKRGLKLFVGKAACVACHASPQMSDNNFECTSVMQSGPHVPAVDLGRYDAIPQVLGDTFNSDGAYSDDRTTGRLQGLVQGDANRGQFRTKDLRQIAETAPYMHDGSLATLEDVVAFYNAGGSTAGFSGTRDARVVPLNLGTAEQADLVAFLRTLTGDPIPDALLADTSR